MKPIDGDDLLRRINFLLATIYTPEFVEILKALKEHLEKAPTLTLDDLRPKGRWIMKETMIRSPFAKNAYCSECNEETSFLHDFCPSCGADMRGGDK